MCTFGGVDLQYARPILFFFPPGRVRSDREIGHFLHLFEIYCESRFALYFLLHLSVAVIHLAACCYTVDPDAKIEIC